MNIVSNNRLHQKSIEAQVPHCIPLLISVSIACMMHKVRKTKVMSGLVRFCCRYKNEWYNDSIILMFNDYPHVHYVPKWLSLREFQIYFCKDATENARKAYPNVTLVHST